MLYPTIDQLAKDEFNRYELALATAKCARKITDEYVQQRELAEKSSTGNKEADRNAMNAINKEYREEKAVKIAINKIYAGSYKMVRVDTAEQEAVAEEVTAQETEDTSAEA